MYQRFFCLLIWNKITVDEEQDASLTNSSLKSTINPIFSAILTVYGISTEEVRNKNSGAILTWFKYLTTSLMPTLPVWSNLLL
ncbi:unnamed protein product, partial [Rotaria sp. Silwood1]